MAKVDYPKYKILIDPDSKKVQGLMAGDVVRREYYDAPRLIYSLMVVLETGTEMVGEAESAHFIGALIEGDEPLAGQLLDFVRVTNLFDEQRTGALYLTASDSDSPYMDVIDGAAKEFSLCYPVRGGGDPDHFDRNKYARIGSGYLDESYTEETDGVSRIYRLTRTSQGGLGSFGLKNLVELPVESSQQTILISMRVRASISVAGIPVIFGYGDGTRLDFTDTFSADTEWKYKLLLFSVDYPPQYERAFSIDLTGKLSSGQWFEIAELNIVRLSDISQFGKATKARVGKVKGVVDPVFGVLDGYGAYFQNLYATRNVNIAGTLTAGDENGFSSTFYVGKIHRNVILNSLNPEFIELKPAPSGDTPPAGVGNSWIVGAMTRMEVQSALWRAEHTGKTYCFSIWVKATQTANVSLYQDEHHIKDLMVDPATGWRRYYGSLKVKESMAGSMIIRIDSSKPGVLISSPQLEAGGTPSQYQPTDGTLSYVEDYGAWFSKGGIGGTIQNPLLRLNEDGSISSRDGSFVINPDGTGHFASGRFRWNKNTITLQDFTLRWEDLSEEARENLRGETGAAGRDGIDGRDGEQGPAGRDGRDGCDGEDGAQGPAGRDGVDGKDGAQGLPGRDGADGRDGVDANLLDWVGEWDSGKTVIDGNSVITPKIYTGTRNANGTITGVALGHFSLLTRNSSGQFQSEAISGIYGFRDGYRTFAIDISGSVEIGRGMEYIRYNAATGKIEFGSAVAMQWVGATYIDANGIFTGTLSADIITALRLDASQITAGTIDTARLNVGELKAQLITADNIDALTLNVVRGNIGGFSIDADSLYRGTKKNTAGAFTSASGSVTIGSNGIRGFKWRLESSGAGAIAGGNIAWDGSGNVTFADSVSLYWKNEASEALEAAKEYADEQTDQLRDDATELVDATKELALAMAYGRMLYRDPTFYNGMNGIFAYNNSGGETVTLARQSDTTAPNDSKYIIRVCNTGTSSPGCGGFRWSTATQYRKVFITRIIARIPVGRSLVFATNSIGTGGTHKWLTSSAGTGEWQEYIYKVTCGTTNFSPTNYFYINGAVGTPSAPVEWDIAYATVFDVTSTERLTTTIDANGIYTGTLTAGQVNAVDIDASSIKTGYLSSDRILAGSITAAKLNAQSVQASLITTEYIEGLELDFTRGKIGGWTITSDSITSGTIGTSGQVGIQLRTTSSGSGTIYSGGYKPAGITVSWTYSNNAGHITFGQVAATASTPKSWYYGIQMMDRQNREYFCLAASTTASSVTVYNRIAGWTFDHQQISKGNVLLGSDGSIYNGTKWKLNNDGSGQIANGNISWDASGTVTFAEAVSLNWSNGIDAITTALGGSSYPKLTYISSTGIYTGTLTANQINVTGINASNITTGTLAVARLAAGSITADKLNVSSVQASIVTATSIEGLTLNFQKGTIGGWTIATDNISSGNVGVSGATAIQIRTASSGSSYWYNGSYKPAGFAVTWNYSSNGGHIVMGQVAASASSVKTGYYGIQMMDRNGREYFCLAAHTTNSSVAVYNRIAGWTFDYQQIYKGNVYLSSDGSIYNSTCWRLMNDGSGQIAGGNISWNASGVVTFASAVSLNWTTPIDNITDALGGSSFPKMTYIGSTGIYTGTIKASQIEVDSTLVVGGSTYNGMISVRNASNSEMVKLDRTGITAIGGKIGGWTITSSSLYSGSVYIASAGNIYNGSYWRLASDGSGQLATSRISWTAAGVLTVKNAIIQDAVIKGTLRAPFVRADGSIVIVVGEGSSAEATRSDTEKYDNLCIIGGSDSGGWDLQPPSLPWDVSQSGRRLVLTHYRYNSEYLYGTCTLTAKSGYYFYEYGRQTSVLKMSRETIELIGYGTSTQFYGWIVLNRRDLLTTSKYGAYGQYLAMGRVNFTSGNSCTLKYKTYDGTTGVSVTKSGTGYYTVYLPWSLGADAYMVVLTGKSVSSSGGPIYATVKAQYSSYFVVQTQDDSSANDGSFNFVVVSIADFT